MLDIASPTLTELPGGRLVQPIGDVHTETGRSIPDAEIAFQTWGQLSADRDNAVLVLHALTGDSHVVGPTGPGHPTPGWWPGLVGPGAALDTERYFIVAPNALGGCRGSTGPSSPAPDGRAWGSRFPALTVRDQVNAELQLADALGIDSWAMVLGGSMGGMRALEWAVMAPERVRVVAPIATTAQSSADQIAWCHAQVTAIRADAEWHGGDYYDVPGSEGPIGGLEVARRIAHTTYRSAAELEQRFARDPQGDGAPLDGTGRFAVQSYLDHHAESLVRRFDANTYLNLTQAMMTHDLARGRGDVKTALQRITAHAVVIAVDSDRLYLSEQSRTIADGIGRDTPVHLIHSPHGHDGFLIEIDQLAALVRDGLARR